MDLQMPVMGGIEAALEILKQFPTLKIVPLSVSNHPADQIRAREAGMHGFLSKPIRKPDFQQHVRQLLLSQREEDDEPLSETEEDDSDSI